MVTKIVKKTYSECLFEAFTVLQLEIVVFFGKPCQKDDGID